MSTNRKTLKANLRLSVAVAALAVSGLGAAGSAHAQAAADGAPTAGAVTEVVITAERRSQNLQTVPISATVLNADQLADRGVNRLTDLQQIAPSLTVNLNNRSFAINIRGIGLAATAPTSTPGVAYYINGSLIPHEQTIGGSFYDIDSVQILRGPQGTLTGQNSTGGAIYITTPKPKFGAFSAMIDQTIGDYDWHRTVAAVNVPMGDMFALRVAGVYDRRDSFTENRGPSGRTPGNLHYDGYRADLAFKPTDKLQANLRYEYFRNATDWIAVKNRNDLVTSDPFVIEEDGKAALTQKGYRSELEVRWDFNPGLQLRWNTNYQYGINVDWGDADRTATQPTLAPVNAGRIAYGETGFNTLVNEINLISTAGGPLEWVVGAFDFLENVPVLQYTYGNDRVEPTRAPTRTTRTEAHNRSRSIFGQFSYRFSPQWQIIAGGRYSKDRQAYDRIVPLALRGVAESNSPTGRIAINYSPADRTLIYASLSKGYKSGGVNLGATDPNIKPETNVVGELGAKTTLMDGHLRVNGDVFYSDYKNLQLGGLTDTTPATPTFKNVPKSKSYGVELELQGVFGPWSINAGGALLKAESNSDAGLSNSTGIGPAFTIIPSGTGLPYSPKVTFNAGIQYELQAFGGSITPRLQYSYQSSTYTSMFRNANSFVESRGLLDARITYDRAQWRAEAFITNLTDKTYVAMQIADSSSLFGGRLYGAPRQVGARLTYKYN
ncbi:MAG: TonB-dependent receptor [Caulobacteraceae bacterium]